MTGKAVKRTKSGCWTCRLRRKKCNESGPPCDNCEARGIHCHGYGPKPHWKDRGALEREEFLKLQDQSGKARSHFKRTMSVAAQKPADGGMVPISSNSSSTSTSGNSIHVGGEGPNGAQEEQLGETAAPLPAGIGQCNCQLEANSAAGVSSLTANTGLVFGENAVNPTDFDFDFDFMDSPSDCTAEKVPDGETGSAIYVDWSQFPMLSPELPAPASAALSAKMPPTPISPHIHAKGASPAAASADVFDNQGLHLHEPHHGQGQLHGIAEGDRGIELTMRYMDDVCSGRSVNRRRISEMGWLVRLLKRSPTFYYTTLSLTSYQEYLRQSTHGTSQAELYRDYQIYRSQALKSFSEMPSSAIKAPFGTSGPVRLHSVLCERLVCSTHLAYLEATSGNIQDCQSHLDAAACLLVEHEKSLIDEARYLSSMEREALAFFTARLIWNDILLSSTRRTVPTAEKVYRRLLLADAKDLGPGLPATGSTAARPLMAAVPFRELTGCESAVMLAHLDVCGLSAWRDREEAAGSLSIRALVARADKIEAAVEGEITRLSGLLSQLSSSKATISSSGGTAKRIRVESGKSGETAVVINSLIFAHAALTDLYQTLSGPRSNVPEIGESISRAIASAWSLRQVQCGNGAGLDKILAWPFCVTASLAQGQDRDVFQEILTMSEDLGESSSGIGVQQLKPIIEQCWAGSSSNYRDWKEVVRRSNQYGVFFM